MKNKDLMKDILLGMAVGDALGVPYEFLSREEAGRRVTENMQGWGTHNQPPGTWSDDTSLALCTADAIAKGYRVDKVAQNFVKWLDEGFWTPHGKVFDIGGTTQDAINRLHSGVDPVLAGGEDEMDNGNGSLMRILPILWYFEHIGHYDIRMVAELSAITHGHPRSMTACVILVRFAQLILQHGIRQAYDEFKQEMQGDSFKRDEQVAHFSRLQYLDELPESEIRSDGYVIHTLEVSIWCLLKTENYKDAVLKAVRLGGDTDTTACVVGGLAGIAYGWQSIPADWLDAIARKEDIMALCERLQEYGV
jgi:ADP-ribosyl-[dinitrogen reductase] hydrolase